MCWRTFRHQKLKNEPFFSQVNCEESRAERTGSCLPNIIPNYTVHLHPPVTLHNLLPYDLKFILEVHISVHLCMWTVVT